MSKLLEEIRKQPEHIRHTMMWLCVVITFSLVAFVWFRSTQAKFVALLHSEEIREEIDPRRFVERIPESQNLAEVKKEQSLFASIGKTFSLLKASIVDLVGASTNEFEINKSNAVKSNLNEGRALPLSGGK